jgi:capsid protein
MKVIDRIKTVFGAKIEAEKVIVLPKESKAPKAYGGVGFDGMIGIHEQSLQRFDGEKNLGAMGPAVHYLPDYYKLSTRSWQAYTDSPLAIAIINKWVNWIIGEGLKLKSNPSRIVLESEGVKMDKKQRETFNDIVEARFTVWSESKLSSITGESNFNETTRSIYLNSKISGDVLTVLRYVNGMVKIQEIDGARVMNASFGTPKKEGNVVFCGVEIDLKTGSVYGYHVSTGVFLETEFIPAYSKTGIRTAFLVKGTKWRMQYHRGMPAIGSTLESISHIDRFREATLSSAEEIAKIVFQVVHQAYSSGENVDAQAMVTAFQEAAGMDGKDLPNDDAGEQLANKIAVTTGNKAYNNPVGAEIKPISKGESVSGFTEFYKTNADVICACVGIPPNIAMSIYNDSFSASRAATKDWDHTMDVERYIMDSQYFSYVYKFWLFTEIANGKIKADGYLEAFVNKEVMIQEAYELARFTGPHFPHIDPDKEVKAQRRMLGPLADHLNLTTIEQSMEELGTGDSDSAMEQFSDEIAIGKSLGLVAPEKQVSGVKN